MVADIKAYISEEQALLLEHPLYKEIKTPEHLHLFLEHHVYAVWDFMSLLKALQHQLTCTTSPWIPVGNPETRYLINEIVLAEETDVALDGTHQSHFEMYLDAMISSEASIRQIQELLATLKSGISIFTAIENTEIPNSIKQFLQFTFNVIAEGKPHKIAAAFTFGREDLIPSMFTSILKNMQENFPDTNLEKLIYYFERHIELDEDEHGPMALQMVSELCLDDTAKWQEAKEISKQALQSRIKLWDGIQEAIKTNK
ncbi:DUF3050 domain-containing protein [Zhouia sp. PK063]|uniref:DUF3050 domain-containing protein n=1 Tax=Zhouia sp. PK063 TaxID=3373602 RepID=UPI0037922C59